MISITEFKYELDKNVIHELSIITVQKCSNITQVEATAKEVLKTYLESKKYYETLNKELSNIRKEYYSAKNKSIDDAKIDIY